MRTGATRSEIARARLHTRIPAPPLSLLPSPPPSSSSPLLSSSTSPFLLLAATHTRTHARTTHARARLFPRRFYPPSQAPPSSPPRAHSRTFCRRFFTAVAVVAVATISPLVSFPGLNSGNGTNIPLDSTLPSPLLSAVLHLQTAQLSLLLLLQHSCDGCCPWGYIPRMALGRSPPPILPSSRAPTVVVAAAAVAVYPQYYFWDLIPGICRVYLFLHRDR